jgi:cell division protein FtsA
VRIGRPPHLRGLPEAQTLAGLVLYAAADPVDIRSIGPSYQPTGRYSGTALVRRLFKVAKEYF